MKLKQIFIAFLSVIALYSCSEKEDIPADADDNFITKVTVSVAGETYSAVIASDTITVTVPYTVSLNGASATVEFTPSAKSCLTQQQSPTGIRSAHSALPPLTARRMIILIWLSRMKSVAKATSN